MTDPRDPDPDPLAALMAAMAAGDLTALWTFHETYAAKLRHIVLANVRSMHRPDVATDRDRIDGLTADAAMVIGDPSPARTVAHHLGLSAANARQVHRRHFARVQAEVWADDRYAELRDWQWFAA